jgi:hypothetical protein
MAASRRGDKSVAPSQADPSIFQLGLAEER